MSDADRPQREVAHRVFATEYNQSTYTYRESDEERAPNYLVTPTGARVNRLFVVGVLTEVEAVGDDVLRARIADPTGALVVYAGQYQPEAMAYFEDADPPAFVAVTGKANTFQPDEADRIFTSIRPESVTTVDAETRDRWIVTTAERTLERIAVFAAALDRQERGDELSALLRSSGVSPGLTAGIPIAIHEYGSTKAFLGDMRRVALETVQLVAGELDEVQALNLAPSDGTGTDLSLQDTPGEPPQLDDAVTTDEQPAATDRTVEETTPEPGSVGEQVGPTDDAGIPAEAEPASEPGETVEREAGGGGTGGGVDKPASESGTDQPDEDGDLYELDDEERQAVQEEYGVEFSSGDDIPDAGEADIDTPDTTEEQHAEPTEEDADDGSTVDDLEDTVIDEMRALADGGGADRNELIERVKAEEDVSKEAVQEAIQAALMSGRCYESDDDELTPI